MIGFTINRKVEGTTNIRLKEDEKGKRAVFGSDTKLQGDPHFSDHILFYEYFHGDSGKGLGASHQTGWTALVAELISEYGAKKNAAAEPEKSEDKFEVSLINDNT